MNFILQFGEFSGDENSFLSDLIVAVVGAVLGGFLGTGSALILYYRQTKDQKKKESSDKEQLQKSKLKYLLYLLNSTILAVDKLIESLEGFCNSAKANPAQIPQLALPPIYDLNRLVNIINQEDHYLAYITLVKNDKISNIFSNVDFLYGTITDTEKRHYKIQEYDLARRKQFALSAETMIYTINESHQALLKKYGPKDSNFIIANNAILEYYKALKPDPSDLLKVRNEFLDPLLSIIVHIKGIDEITNITESVSKTNKLLTPIILSNEEYSKEINELVASLRRTNKKMKTLVVDLYSFVDRYTF